MKSPDYMTLDEVKEFLHDNQRAAAMVAALRFAVIEEIDRIKNYRMKQVAQEIEAAHRRASERSPRVEKKKALSMDADLLNACDIVAIELPSQQGEFNG